MFELYTYNEYGELVFQSEHETHTELNKCIDSLLEQGQDTYWEWVEE